MILDDPVVEGQTRRVAIRFLDKTQANSPPVAVTGVTFTAKPPGIEAIRNSYTVETVSAGVYAANILFDIPGRWWIKAACTGPVVDMGQDYIDVEKGQVP